MIYLDNSATTNVYDTVIDEIARVYRQANYNPSAAYDVASEAEKILENARKTIASSINAQNDEVYFTSGGSEGNNAAILGVSRACKNRGNHIITTSVEHDSVYNAIKYLESEEGYKVTYISPDSHGEVSAKEVEDSVDKDTILVSVMHVNNETGSVNDIEKINKAVKQKNHLTIMHSDSVQSYMKLPIDVEQSGVDIITASAHKVHGPKGIGFMYIRKNTKIQPLIYGGGQERGFRSGTENVALASGFAKAVSQIQGNKEYADSIRKSRDYLKILIEKNIRDININTPETSAPHILSVSFAGVRSEVLLHYLETDKIYVSTGSACSARKKGSRVLKNIGLPEIYADGTVRFSLDENSSKSDMDIVCEKLIKYIDIIRKATRYKLK